ncbi:hypothetical protein XcvCFBP7113P_19495 [Xanthomonas citri pv. vignicola]|nr:hypothetical protein XcvCFBP7113P_19495 [Xanthomonas citri pv. vignicola]
MQQLVVLHLRRRGRGKRLGRCQGLLGTLQRRLAHLIRQFQFDRQVASGLPIPAGPLPRLVSLVDLPVVSLHLTLLGEGAFHGCRHLHSIVAGALRGMVFQVGGGDGFAPGGNVAFDAAKGFLVELLRAFRRGGLVLVAAPVVGTGHGGFDLAFPCLALRIAVPVLVV